MGGSSKLVAAAAVHAEENFRKGSPQAFPLKLYEIVSSADDSVIAWSEAGDSFYVVDMDRFASEVLPNHFRHNHFSSFQRQLNLYGFKRIAADGRRLAFQHDSFVRDRLDLLPGIKRAPQWSTAKELRRQKALLKEREANQEANKRLQVGPTGLKRKNPFDNDFKMNKQSFRTLDFTDDVDPSSLPPAQMQFKSPVAKAETDCAFDDWSEAWDAFTAAEDVEEIPVLFSEDDLMIDEDILLSIPSLNDVPPLSDLSAGSSSTSLVKFEEIDLPESHLDALPLKYELQNDNTFSRMTALTSPQQLALKPREVSLGAFEFAKEAKSIAQRKNRPMAFGSMMENVEPIRFD